MVLAMETGAAGLFLGEIGIDQRVHAGVLQRGLLSQWNSKSREPKPQICSRLFQGEFLVPPASERIAAKYSSVA
jgi:hypothetical protein